MTVRFASLRVVIAEDLELVSQILAWDLPLTKKYAPSKWPRTTSLSK